ncbi:MAG: VOC family protein [Dehalococcoidia bacterium]|nr:VOC family protein [Dehalococcoidia bacterium]MCB9486537.1 VOC family protein [Thermoflexaceae bacterium]
MPEDWARPVVHWEIRARDPEAQRAFYGALFNWTIGEGRVMNIGAGIGAPEPISGHIARSENPGVILSIQVLDLRATMDKAVALGGKILNEPKDLPQGPTIAAIADPEGNRISLIQQ